MILSVPVRCGLGATGIILFYVGATMIKGSEEGPDNSLGRMSNKIRERGESVLKLQTAFLRRVCEKFVLWFDECYVPDIFGLSIGICAITNALVFLFIPRYYEPSIPTKILFAILFFWGLQNRWKLLLISCFPFFYRWWRWFTPVESLRSGSISRSELISAIETLLVELLIVIGVILGAALVMVLLLCLTRLFTGLARNSKVPLAYLSILLLCYGVVAIASQLPLLRPDLVFPNRWLVPDPDNLMSLIVVQAMVYLGLLTILPALTAVAIILLMLAPFMHKIIWPLLWKPLDQLNRKLHNTAGLLMSGGAALVAIAWPGSALLNVLEKIHSLL